MPRKPKISDDAAELRRRAEARLRDRQKASRSKPGDQKSKADIVRVLHELEVHGIELEMQNAELQEATHQLEAALEKYTDLYDFAPVGYVTLDSAGDIREANLAAASLLGITRSGLVNRRFGQFVSPADLPAFGAFLQKVLECGTKAECDLQLLVEGKPPVDVRMRANVLESAQTCRVALTDISNHKRAEEQLKASVKEVSDLRFALDEHAIVAITDPQGKITYANDKFCAISKYSREELLGQDHRILNSGHHSKEFMRDLWTTIAQGRAWHGEIKNKAKDGSFYWVHATIVPFLDDQGKPRQYVAIRTDITEHVRAEADRLVLNKLESTGVLAAGLAHDFNNLLTVILLDLELAQALAPPGEKLAQLLEEAKKAGVAASSLTRQLITFAKGGAPIRKPTRLSEVIQESVRPALSGANVRCEFSLAEDLWMAEVDAGQIAQVIRNLVLNAREAMPQGGVVSVRAENAVLNAQESPSLPAGDYVRVSIVDRGAGIAEDVLPKIFDPYFSMKERGNQKGMGLGLTICHAVIQRHGGAITVESKVGVGTTFHIHLPASRKLGDKEKPPGPTGVPRHGRVLVMDDEEAVRKVVALTLWGMGHEVEVAENGQMAVEFYKRAQRLRRPFDVVILDLTVRAGMGGQEAIQALLEIDPAVKAIAMSGYVHDPVILEPKPHGFEGTLAKPFAVGKLEEMLCRIMSGSPDGKTAPCQRP
jgi:PAS domain S-box-containing protein